MKLTAEQISKIVGGTVEGDPGVEVSLFSKIEEAQAGSLSFLSNPKYEPYLYTTRASVVLVSQSLAPSSPVGATLVRCADPYAALAKLMQLQEQMTREVPVGISEGAYVHPEAQLGEGVYVAPHAFIDKGAVIGPGAQLYPQVYVGPNARVGKGTILMPGVKVYRDCALGEECLIHAGTVIGSDGFGFAPQQEGQFQKIPQLGNVVIEDHVEIGANCTIDRATMGSTLIRRGVKLDNLIQVAHNVEIGENTVIASQTGISGSTKIGPNCMVGGQVGFAGHLNIAAGVKIGAQAGIHASIEPGQVMQGSPAMPMRQFYQTSAVIRRLPDMWRELNALRKELDELKSTTKPS